MNATLPPPDLSTHLPPSNEHPGAASKVPDRFVRPRQGRRIGGVCAAIADRFGWDRTVVRLVTLFSVLLPGPQVIAYLVGWILIPGEEEVGPG